MLFYATVTKWEGCGKDPRVKDTTNGTVFLLNGNRLNGLEIRSSTKSKFMYVDNHKNPREKASYIEAGEANSTIITDIDKTWNSMVVLLNFYTDNDTTKATFARKINVEDIAYVYFDQTYHHTKSWVVYYEGGKRMELICSYSLKQILSLVDDGNLTTG
jgi:hypothetical protein